MDYTPQIKDRETEDLIEIYLSPKGNWQDDAVKQATSELLNRGYTIDELNTISVDFQKYQKEIEIKEQKRLEKNATISYSLISMIIIFFCSPFILVGKFRLLSQHMTLTDLHKEKFKLKFRQRLFLLIGGLLFWFIVVKILSDFPF